MEKYFFGVFNESVELFGIIIVILLIVVGFIVSLVIKKAIRKIDDLEQFHNDIIAVRLEMEGRQSFTDTIRRHDFEIKDLYRKNGETYDHIRRIDTRCERRIEQQLFDGQERRIKD